MARSAPGVSPLKVVIAEGDAEARHALKEMLEGKLEQRVVGEAATGTDMVRIVRETEPDVVLFDLHLPPSGGLDALRQVNDARPVAAVALTAGADPEMLRRAVQEGVFAYLIEPVEAHQLGPMLHVAWDRFAERRALADENAALKQSIQESKLFERAKGALMKRHGWTADEALRRLERAALARGATPAEVARDFLAGVEVNL